MGTPRKSEYDLEKLRAAANLGSYLPVGEVPFWLDALSSVAKNDLGVVALLGPSGLSVRARDGSRKRASFDQTGVLLAGLADRIRGSTRRIAVGCPPVGRHLPLLLTSSAVLANTLDRSRGTRRLGDGGVLVISPDVEARSRYCDLFVKHVALESAYPGSRLRPNGESVPLSPTADDYPDGGVCFFLPRLALPQHIDLQPSLIIVDFRYSRWVNRALDLARWCDKTAGRAAGVIALYSLGDRDTLDALTESGFSDLPMDHSAVATCFQHTPVSLQQVDGLSVEWRLADAPAFLDRKHVVCAIPNAECLEEALNKVAILLEENSTSDCVDIRRARWILAALTHMSVPLPWYEETARNMGRSTLRRLIAQLGTRSRFELGLGATLQTARVLFEEVYNRLGDLNVRAESLRMLLLDTVRGDENGDVLLLVRDQVNERALSAWLEVDAFNGAPWLSRVDVHSCQDYASASTHRYSSAIISGAFPRRYRWIAGASLASRVFFLAYRHEASIIRQQLESVYSDSARSKRAGQRQQVVSTISPVRLSHRCVCDSPVAGLDLALPQVPVVQGDREADDARITIKNLRELAKALETKQNAARRVEEERTASLANWWEDPGEEEEPEEEPGGSSAGGIDDISCFRVHVRRPEHDDSTIWLSVTSAVEFVRPSAGDELQRQPPAKLLPGDVLLVMDERVRSSLFDRIVELAEEEPQMRYLSAFRLRWKEALQRMVAPYCACGQTDYRGLLRTLRSFGATIESELAVRLWVDEYVIGPESISSIIAVGKVSGSSSLVDHAKDFDRAFRQIRGVRQSIGRRLNAAIRASFRHVAEGIPEAPSDGLDQRLAIPVEELVETIELAEVVSVSRVVEMVAPHVVGRLRPLL